MCVRFEFKVQAEINQIKVIWGQEKFVRSAVASQSKHFAQSKKSLVQAKSLGISLCTYFVLFIVLNFEDSPHRFWLLKSPLHWRGQIINQYGWEAHLKKGKKSDCCKCSEMSRGWAVFFVWLIEEWKVLRGFTEGDSWAGFWKTEKGFIHRKGWDSMGGFEEGV